MTTVTIHGDDSPTEQVIAKAQKNATIEDSQGRKIVLKKPGVLAQYRIIEVAGDAAKNEVWMRMVLPLIFVTEIAGNAVAQPTNRIQLDGLIQLLDEHGIEAVMNGVMEHFGASDPEKDKAEIKK